MSQSFLFRVALAAVPLWSACTVLASSQVATVAHKEVLYSNVLEEHRAYWVSLPDDYAGSDTKHPIVYLLDGKENLRVAVGVVDFLSRERAELRRIPAPIVIAIENTHRVRDFTPTRSDKDSSGFVLPGHENAGGAHAFLKFLEEELISSVERAYRVADYRVLVGHSYGGLFSLYTFLERPRLFNGIVAIDPSLYFDDAVLVRRARETLPKARDRAACIYIAIADHPETEEFKTMVAGIDRFAKIMKRSPSRHLHSTLQLIGGESHSSVPLLALYHGLPFAFTGIAPSDISSAGGSAHRACGSAPARAAAR